MLVEQQNMKDTEKEYGTFTAVKDDEGVWRTENVQLNNDHSFLQLESDPICPSSGCQQDYWNSYTHPAPKDLNNWPRDYFVPDFGQDHDIIGSLDNIALAQAHYNTTWSMGTAESKAKFHNPAKDVMYNYAPDLDGDIIDSQSNLANAEDSLGKKYELP